MLLLAKYELPFWLSYVIAWGGACGVVWTFFERLDRLASSELKALVTTWIRSDDLPQGSGTAIPANAWPNTFLRLFDQLFGELLSRSGATRSVVASTIFFVLSFCFVLLLVPSVRADLSTASWSTLLAAIPVLITMNWLPDYLSLIESRFVLQKLQRSQSMLSVISILLLDLLLTTLVFWVCGMVFGVSIFVIEVFPFAILVSDLWQYSPNSFRSNDVVMEIVHVLIGISFLTTYLTSVWVWLYASSISVLRISARLSGAVKFFNWAFDIDEHPIVSLGYVCTYGLLFLAFSIGGYIALFG